MRDAYTGADCSLKVCPYGRSHDYISDASQELLNVNFNGVINGAAVTNGDSNVALWKKGDNTNSVPKLKAFLNNGFLYKQDIGVDVQVVSVDSATGIGKFSWKLNTEKTFNKEETFTAGGANAERKSAYHIRPLDASNTPQDTGLYIYFDLPSAPTAGIYAKDFYYLNVTRNEGMKFASDDLNTAHGFVECAGRGTCDRAAGVCKCVDGYDGDACQRTSCPNDCSGHGTCQSQYYFVSDANAAGSLGLGDYKAFDADGQMGCKCDAGFRGADCSQIECPSGPDPLKGDGGKDGRDCSGRGSCDYQTGTCNCFKGFFGERCEEQTNLK
jgi:hypothetical protein